MLNYYFFNVWKLCEYENFHINIFYLFEQSNMFWGEANKFSPTNYIYVWSS